ncbi:MAG: hypothetical protein LQ337_005856 [Flavoplaca oasis]|nr:MAG: hypothetical protein LQ337_005856 [Flavoplaca oasis]
MRETIWQKCLESHKDISFFVDCKTLAKWPLMNGRDISNAVTTARTLARDGTLNMGHLERVVPAIQWRTYKPRRPDELYEIVPSSKPKDKKEQKYMKLASAAGIKVFNDPANSDTGDLRNHKDWDINRRTTRSPFETDWSDDSVDKTKTFRKCRTSNWVGEDASKRCMTQSPPPSTRPVSGERIRPYPNPWFFGPLPLPRTISPPYPPLLPPAFNSERTPSFKDTWGFRPPPPPPQTITPPYPHPPSPRPTTSQRIQPVANAWGFRPPPQPREVTPPHPPSPRPTARGRNQSDTRAWGSEAVKDEDDWGSFGTKKSKKATKTSAKHSDMAKFTGSPPIPAINDSWGGWGSARKDVKSPQVKLPSRPVGTSLDWSKAEEEPPTMPDDDVDWINFGRKKDQKAKKPMAVEPEASSPGATKSPVMPDADLEWANFGRKNCKKARKPTAKEPEASSPASAIPATQPILPPVEVDDWDSWLTSRNPDKGKKTRIIDQAMEHTASPSESIPPVTNAIPIERPQATSPPSRPHHPFLCINCHANRPILRGTHCFECTPPSPKISPRRTATEKHHCLSCGLGADLSGDELVCTDCRELYG